jgi:hypothetical protein
MPVDRHASWLSSILPALRAKKIQLAHQFCMKFIVSRRDLV